MVPAEGLPIPAVEEEFVFVEVQLTVAILNAIRAMVNFFMNGFISDRYLKSKIFLKTGKVQQPVVDSTNGLPFL